MSHVTLEIVPTDRWDDLVPSVSGLGCDAVEDEHETDTTPRHSREPAKNGSTSVTRDLPNRVRTVQRVTPSPEE
jgi:hypothetical protein